MKTNEAKGQIEFCLGGGAGGGGDWSSTLVLTTMGTCNGRDSHWNLRVLSTHKYILQVEIN